MDLISNHFKATGLRTLNFELCTGTCQ